MRQTAPVLFALAVGLVLGVGGGFVLSGGSRGPARASAPMDSIGRDASIPRRGAAETVELAAAGPLSATAPAPTARDPLGDLSASQVARAEDLGTDAAARVSALPVEPAADGTGVITGQVVDGFGAPVEGAHVVVSGRSFTGNDAPVGTDSASVGRAWKGFDALSDEVEEYAQSRMKTKRLDRAAETDASGQFSLDRLPEGRHYLTAYAEGFVFSGQRVRTGSPTRFVGVPVGVYDIDVRMPDGSQPDSAVIVAFDAEDDPSPRRWSPDQAKIRLPQTMCKLGVLAGEVTRIQGGNYAADLRATPRVVDLERDGAGPHVFSLQQSMILRVTIDDQSTVVPRISPWVRLRPEGGGENASKRLRSSGGGPFAIADLPAGTYEITAGRGDSEALVTETIELISGLNEHELALRDMDIAEFLVVRCSDARGRPVLDVDFRYEAKKENGRRSGSFNPITRGAGEFWVHRSKLLRDDEEAGSTTVTLTVTAGAYGAMEQELDMDASEVSFVFREQCNLTVEVVGADGSALRVAVQALADGSDAPTNDRQQFRNTTKVGPDGVAVVGSVQPGRVRVVAIKGTGRRAYGTPLTQLVTQLSPGDQTVQLVVPELYDLVVHAPDSKVGSGFGLLTIDPDGGSSSWLSAEVEDDQRVRFSGLLGGTYMVSNWGGSSGQMEVVVPCGEVLFAPVEMNAMRVNAVVAGKGVANAGIQNGDVVIQIGVHAVEQQTFWNRLTLDLADGDVTLRVVRGGNEFDAVIKKVEKGTNLWAEVGAEFTATLHP